MQRIINNLIGLEPEIIVNPTGIDYSLLPNPANVYNITPYPLPDNGFQQSRISVSSISIGEIFKFGRGTITAPQKDNTARPEIMTADPLQTVYTDAYDGTLLPTRGI